MSRIHQIPGKIWGLGSLVVGLVLGTGVYQLGILERSIWKVAVTFTYTPPLVVPIIYTAPGPARSVAIAGTFNDWNPNTHPLRYIGRGNRWMTTLELYPGDYAYKMVFNGHIWFADSQNQRFEADGFGGVNSILTVNPERYRPSYRPRIVAVAGDFNGWDPDADLLARGKYSWTWTTTLHLFPGTYAYKIIINRYDWLADPKSLNNASDAFGPKSILQVKAPSFWSALSRQDLVAADAIYHEQRRPYLNVVNQQRVILRLRTRKDDVNNAELYYDDGAPQQVPLTKFASLDGHDYYHTQIAPQRPAFTYQFVIHTPRQIVYLGPSGISRSAWRVGHFSVNLKDHLSFEPPHWVAEAIFYQILPDRFANGDRTNDPAGTRSWYKWPVAADISTAEKARQLELSLFYGGDLQGVIDRLPHLQRLGVNAIYFNPVFASPSNNKYDISDYLRIDPHLGSLETFQELLRRCHALGIRVMLDGVFNHTGDSFWAFRDAVRKGRQSPYWDWYFITRWPLTTASTLGYESWWHHTGAFAHLPRLNVDNPEVQRYLLDVVSYWTKMGVDGWRLDAPYDVSHAFWQRFRSRVRAINPQAYLVGELWHSLGPYLRGDQFDSSLNFPLREYLLDFVCRGNSVPSEFDRHLAYLRVEYVEQVIESMYNLTGNHDTDRLLSACGDDMYNVKLWGLLQIALPGAPGIYYGDEIGMKGQKEVFQYAYQSRGPMVWDPAKQNKELLDHYRKLFKIRRSHVALSRGKFYTHLVDDKRNLYAFRRQHKDEQLLIVVNNSDVAQSLSLPVTTAGYQDGQHLRNLLDGHEFVVRNGRAEIGKLPARSAMILMRS